MNNVYRVIVQNSVGTRLTPCKSIGPCSIHEVSEAFTSGTQRANVTLDRQGVALVTVIGR